MELRSLMRRAAVVGALALAVGGAAAMAMVLAPRAAQPPAGAVAPSGTRIRVQVLNATPTRGLARRATAFLRDRGFDVVDLGTAPQPRDSTVVIDRSGRGEWARLVARAMGGARVETGHDSSRYLDVTVIVGRDWTPPSEPFYP